MLGPWIKAFGSGQTGDDKSEIKILGIKELKWTGMSEINSDLIQTITSTTVGKNPLEEME